MIEIQPSLASEKVKSSSLEELFSDLLELEPKLITNFVPTNAEEQKSLFLSDAVRNPDHEYAKLDAIDFNETLEMINEISSNILSSAELNPKYRTVYEQFRDNYLQKTAFLQIAHDFNHAEDTKKDDARKHFMRLNIELFGEPDELTYQSIVQEKLKIVKDQKLSGESVAIRSELVDMLAGVPEVPVERFVPSNETMAWMHGVVEGLYGNMLKHVPADQELFSDEQIKKIFDQIIKEEFGDTAEGWSVDIEKAQSINVKSSERRIVIPTGRELDNLAVRQRVVHEIGVHFMRAVTGSDTDLPPLKLGLSGYYDAEEGLGVVMEQALAGEYREAGADHYVTAGLAHYGHKDFRDIYEIKWRLEALASAEDGVVSEEVIQKSKNTAYGSVMRSMRGTDELPWFKDLSYYNGATNMWRHLEEIRGDDLKFSFVLLGKADPANKKHERIMLETSSV